MKSLATSSILITKLLTLLCFTNMGLMTMDMSVQAAEPCHQVATESESAKDCSACVIALNSWSEDYVEISEIEVPDVIIALLNSPEIVENKIALLAAIQQVYRPPPQVILANAFHLPQRSIVIIV